MSMTDGTMVEMAYGTPFKPSFPLGPGWKYSSKVTYSMPKFLAEQYSNPPAPTVDNVEMSVIGAAEFSVGGCVFDALLIETEEKGSSVDSTEPSGGTEDVESRVVRY